MAGAIGSWTVLAPTMAPEVPVPPSKQDVGLFVQLNCLGTSRDLGFDVLDYKHPAACCTTRDSRESFSKSKPARLSKDQCF